MFERVLEVGNWVSKAKDEVLSRSAREQALEAVSTYVAST